MTVAAGAVPAGQGGVMNGNKAAFQGWRSPTPQQTPLVQPGSLPENGNGNGIKGDVSVNIIEKDDSGSNTPSDSHHSTSNTNTTQSSNGSAGPGKTTTNNLHPSLQYPSFQQPCEHSADGDMHSHAVVILLPSSLIHHSSSLRDMREDGDHDPSRQFNTLVPYGRSGHDGENAYGQRTRRRSRTNSGRRRYRHVPMSQLDPSGPWRSRAPAAVGTDAQTVMSHDDHPRGVPPPASAPLPQSRRRRSPSLLEGAEERLAEAIRADRADLAAYGDQQPPWHVQASPGSGSLDRCPFRPSYLPQTTLPPLSPPKTQTPPFPRPLLQPFRLCNGSMPDPQYLNINATLPHESRPSPSLSENRVNHGPPVSTTDLLTLSTASPPPRPPVDLAGASVPTNGGHSFLHAARPPTYAAGAGQASTSANGNGTPSQPPKNSRRMSSSTSQSRGKSGFLGVGAQGPVPPKDGRPAGMAHAASYAGPSPSNSRRLSTSNGSGPTPVLYDFSKTDRPRTGASAGAQAPGMSARTVSTPAGAGGVAASLPVRSIMQERLAHAHAQQSQPGPGEDMELDMQFGGSDDDDRGRRSGSDDIEMDFESENVMTPEVVVAPLGSGSGGIKGRRKGVEFKCEHCAKVYLHPNCLSKHRWEHSPHWREPTAANMSKHQQVQQLEAAAILTFGASLPEDRSLWPSHMQIHERNTRSPSMHPRTSFSAGTSAPRQPSSLGTMGERMGPGPGHGHQERKQSPGSDSTTSSMGAGDQPYTSHAPGLGLRTQPTPSPSRPPAHLHPHPGMSQRAPSFRADRDRRASRTPSFSNAPGHPSSLPDMTGLHFHSASAAGPHNSPIPNRGGIPLSLQSRAGMIGGGMFGAGVLSTVRSSSVRSGAADLPEEEDDEVVDDAFDGYDADDSRAKSSSEEADERRRAREGEEYGMAEEMEL